MISWLRNVCMAVTTVLQGMVVTLRYWLKTYKPERGTFTEKFEYPEKPVPVTARYRGFHRFDLTTCIACDQCAKACPVDCIYIGKERVEGSKGFKITGYTIDYSKCMFCALCVEPCPVDCIFMGATHDLSCYSRDGCIVDFSRLPVEVAWGRSTLNPTAIAQSKVIAEPVHGGPNQQVQLGVMVTGSSPQKCFTVEEANRMLPLVRVIAADLAKLWGDLVERRERLSAIMARRSKGKEDDFYGEELRVIEQAVESESARMKGFVAELNSLGLELGKIDGSVAFPTVIAEQPAYLLWMLGDSTVRYWVRNLEDCDDPMLISEASVLSG